MDIVFDIDDTLFDSSARSHLYRGRDTDWQQFYAMSINDTPIVESVALLKALYGSGHTILLATGRHASARTVTIQKLRQHLIRYDKLYMRPDSDKISRNAQVKMMLLQQMHKDGYRPSAVFEDNSHSCEAWQQSGLTVYKVLNGSKQTSDSSSCR